MHWSRPFWLCRLCSLLCGQRGRVRGRGHRIELSDSRLRSTRFVVEGEGNELVIDRQARLWNCTLQVRGQGARLHIGAGCSLRGVTLVVQDAGSLLSIGARTTMTSAIAVSEEGRSIRLGRDCMVSANAMLRNSDGHSILDEQGRRLNAAQDIEVGDHSWIGTGAHIFAGAVLEGGSIVGAGSLVKGSLVPSGCVAAGRPAKVLRRGVRWERERL